MSKNKLAFGIEPSNRRWRLRLARYVALAEAVLAYTQGRTPPVLLLDVGVGHGRSMRYIEARSPQHRIQFYGLDYSARRLSQVYHRHEWKLVQADLLRGIPFPKQSFDVVVCEQVLEHLTDPGAAVRELGRCLKSGGLLVLGVPIFPAGVDRMRQRLVSTIYPFFKLDREHIQSYSKKSILALLAQSGLFDIFECRGFRIISGGPLKVLEDFYWWYKLNRWLGKRIPSLCTEIQVLATRR